MAVFQISSATDTADTVFGVLVPPVEGKIARISRIYYTSGSTAHTVYVMRPVAQTITDAQGFDVASMEIPVANIGAMTAPNSQTPELVAGNDYVAWRDTNGKMQWGLVAGITGNVIEVGGSYPPGVPSGSPVWLFGELARAPHLSFSPPVSATTRLELSAQGGVPIQLDSSVRSGVGDPLLVLSSNATNAGTIVSVHGSYVDDYATN